MADTADYVRGGIFTLIFLITGVRNRQLWLLSDLMFSSMSGLMIYLNPYWSIQLQTKDVKIDVVHGQLNRLFAASIVGSALFWFMRRRSSSDTVIATMLFSRIVGVFVLLLIILFGQFTYGHIFTDKHFWFGILGNVFWWLANVVQLIKMRPTIDGYQQSRGITLLLHLNNAILTLLSLAYLGYPVLMSSVKGRKVDKYHIHTARAVGAMIMGWNVFSFMAPRFKDKNDVKIVFMCQMLIFLLAEGSFLGLFYGSDVLSQRELMYKLSMFGPLFIISVIGIYLCFKKDEHSNPENKKDK